MVDLRKKQTHHGALASEQADWQPAEADATSGFGDSNAPEALSILKTENELKTLTIESYFTSSSPVYEM